MAIDIATKSTAPELTTSKEFIAKLAAACDAVGGVEKKGKNQEKGYAYLRAADVAKAIRHELFERGIIITQNEMSPEYTEYQTAKGYRGLDCRIAIEFTITDGESSISGIGHGHAMDTSDKPLYKAKTGALKYFLRGLGLIPDEKDDPEVDSPAAEFDRDKYVEQKKKELSVPIDMGDQIAAEGLESIESAWRQRIKNCSTAAEFNAALPAGHDLPESFKKEARKILVARAKVCGFAWDKQLMCFYDPKEKLTKELEASVVGSPPPQESPAPSESASPRVSQGLEPVSKAQEIEIHNARRRAKLSIADWDNIKGKYGAEHTRELQKANFQAVLQDILDHSKIGVRE